MTPFPGRATYAEDNQVVYVKEMFGAQREDFLRKFVKAPLENGQPLIGAVWSVVPGDPTAAVPHLVRQCRIDKHASSDLASYDRRVQLAGASAGQAAWLHLPAFVPRPR